MGRIPKSFINDLIARTDLVDIVQSRLALKRAGKNYIARCPFHDEKTPSFTINPEKQFYYCFGCGAHGNVIGFLMAYNRLDFIDAVQELAARHHVEIPQEDSRTSPTINLKPLYELLESVAQFYQAQLRECSEAISYLKSRGLDGQIAKRFGLGYAPKGWDTLIQTFGNHPQAQALLIECGMAIAKDQHSYDRFRDRIMYPIRDTRGRIVAFGGRTLGDEQPKYLNSPETPVFHKGHELYGLYEAHQKVSEFKKILVVEGYMDVIALAQHQLYYAVATLGTAINTKHIQKLFRYTHQLIFCFDGDNAGRNAAWKALAISLPLMHDGAQVRFLFLPQNEDPDSLIRKIGLEKFERLVDGAPPLADVLFDHLKTETPIDTLENKALFAKKAKEYLNTMPQGLYQQLLYEKLAKELKVDIAWLQQDLAIPLPKETIPKYESKPLPKKTSRGNRILSPEKLAIAILLQSPQLSNTISLNHFESFPISHPTLKLLLQLYQLLQQHPELNIGQILGYFETPEEQQSLSELATRSLHIPQEGWQSELKGAIERVSEQFEFNLAQQLIEKAKTSNLSPTEKDQLKNILNNKTQRSKIAD